MATDCELGLPMPCVALNATELCEGCCNTQGGSTSKFTVIVCGLPEAVLPLASVPFSTTCPTYVLGVKSVVSIVTVTCPVWPAGMVPPVGPAPSHDVASVLTCVRQVSGLLPVLVIVTTCGGGEGMPCVVLKLRPSGVAPKIGAEGGGGGCTINCTITVCVLCAAVNAILLVYVPGFRVLALTPIEVTVLAVPFNCPLAGVIANQLLAEVAFQLIVPAQLEVAPILSD